MAEITAKCNGQYGSHYTLHLEYSSTQNAVNNTSHIKLKMWAQSDSTSYYAYNLDKVNTVNIKVNGATKFTRKQAMDFRNRAKVDMGSWEGDISHDSNGSKTITISGDFTMIGTGCSGGSVSKSWNLPTIARASTPSNSPIFTAPTSVSCSISKKNSSYTHAVTLQLKNSSNSWVDVGTINSSSTTVTFSGTTVMKKVFEVLDRRVSCASRFKVITYSGSTQIGSAQYSGEGTCAAAPANSATAPTFNALSSAISRITKGNSTFKSKIFITVGTFLVYFNETLTDADSITFNTDEMSKQGCVSGLNGASSKNYTVEVETYYEGVRVRDSVTTTGICNAPEVDGVSSPNFTAGNSFTTTISTVSSSMRRQLVLQIYNGSSWQEIGYESYTDRTSVTWNFSEDKVSTIFNALNGVNSRPTRLLVTSYYGTSQVNSEEKIIEGTCSLPNRCTCSAPNWTAGNSFTCAISKPNNYLTVDLKLEVLNSDGEYQVVETKNNVASNNVTMCSDASTNKILLQLMGSDVESTEAVLSCTTYYNSRKIGETYQISGLVRGSQASTLSSIPNWTAGDSFNFSINRQNPSYTHTVIIKVGEVPVITLTNVGSSIGPRGDSDADRIAIFNALGANASKPSSVEITTYYDNMQIGETTIRTGTCKAPANPTFSKSPTWTAGNNLQVTVSIPKDYLYYSVDLIVGSQTVQTYEYQTATELNFANTVELNMKAYEGLNKNASANSKFVVRSYYKIEEDNYIQVGKETITTGTCTAYQMSDISGDFGNWIAGNSFTATISAKVLNIYNSIRLKVNNIIVQEYEPFLIEKNTNILIFGNSTEVNTKIFQALAQADRKDAVLEIFTWYGKDKNNLVQVGNFKSAKGSCKAPEAATGTIRINQNPTIDNVVATCIVEKPSNDYEVFVEVRFNNELITEITPTSNTSVETIVFDSKDLDEDGEEFYYKMYRAIPTATSGSLQFKIVTRYNGVQIRQAKSAAVNIDINLETVGIKIADDKNIATISRINNKDNTFIDNESMIGSKISDLMVNIPQGYFKLEKKFGGYIKEIRAQIETSSSMLKLFRYTAEDIIYNMERTLIVSPEFSEEDAIIMGPYDFSTVTKPGTIMNLIITATDSRDISIEKRIPLKIFPYSSPTIKINQSTTSRIKGLAKYLVVNLDGTLSSLFKTVNGEKVQTNLVKEITMKYKLYSSKGEYSIYTIPSKFYAYPESDEDDYSRYGIINFSTANNIGALKPLEFNINDSFEIILTVTDEFGNTSSDTIVILPDQPLMSFREQRIGINTIPRKIKNIIERSSPNDENPSLDINGFIYSNGREVLTFITNETWTNEEYLITSTKDGIETLYRIKKDIEDDPNGAILKEWLITNPTETNLLIENYKNILDMSNIYRDNTNLQSIALDDTNNVTNMSNAFSGCTALTNILIPTAENVQEMSGMFYNCPLLVKEKLTPIFMLCTTVEALPTENRNFDYIGLVSSQINNYAFDGELLLDLHNKEWEIGYSTVEAHDTKNDLHYYLSESELIPNIHNTNDRNKILSEWITNNSIEEVKFSNLKNIKDLYYRFYNNKALKEIEFADIEDITDLNHTFYNNRALQTIKGLTKENTKNCESLFYTFFGCSSLLDIPEIDTSKVKIFSYAFYNCSKVTSLPNLDCSSATVLDYAFLGMTQLVDIAGFKNKLGQPTLKVNFSTTGSRKLSYESMINIYNSLVTMTETTVRNFKATRESIELLSTAEQYAFANKYWKLVNYDDSSWKPAAVTEAIAKEIVSVVKDTDTTIPQSGGSDKYYYQVNTENNYSVDKQTGMVYTYLDEPKRKYKVIIDNNTTNPTYVNKGIDYDPQGKILKAQNFNKMEVNNIKFYNMSDLTNMEQLLNSSKSVFVTFDNTSNVTNMNALFASSTLLQQVEGLNTSKAKNLAQLCRNCKLLASFPALQTPQMTAMYNMFEGCSRLTTISLSDTSKVTDAHEAFKGCTDLVNLSISTTPLMNDMREMFYGCASLLTVPQLDFSSASKIGGLCKGCTSLTSIPNFDLSNFRKFGIKDILEDCVSLTTIPGFKTSEDLPALNADLDLSTCTNLTHESILNVFDSLVEDLTIYNDFNEYNCLTLSAESIALLTDAEKFIPINKLWILKGATLPEVTKELAGQIIQTIKGWDGSSTTVNEELSNEYAFEVDLVNSSTTAVVGRFLVSKTNGEIFDYMY